MNIINNNFNFILIYLILINLGTFIAFGLDKYKAKQRSWRIPEANLLLLSFIGGSIGGIIGMYFFKHKTLKVKFKIGMPFLLLLNILILYLMTVAFLAPS